jgi:hypothetical protein
MQHNQASKSTLTDKQKFELCQYARDNRQTLKEYVNWVKVNWNVTIHESTISRILKSSDKRLNEDVTSPDTKRHKPVKFPELELALREFVLTYQHRTILNDAIIIEKAKLFANSLKMNCNFPPVGFINSKNVMESACANSTVRLAQLIKMSLLRVVCRYKKKCRVILQKESIIWMKLASSTGWNQIHH